METRNYKIEINKEDVWGTVITVRAYNFNTEKFFEEKMELAGLFYVTTTKNYTVFKSERKLYTKIDFNEFSEAFKELLKNEGFEEIKELTVFEENKITIE